MTVLVSIIFTYQSISTEWSCVNWEVTQFILAYRLSKSLLYIVWLLYKINMLQVSRKKLRVSPFEFCNTYIYNLVTRISQQNSDRKFSFVKFVLWCMCRKFCLSGCLYFIFLCCTEWKLCSFIRKPAVLMPSGNLNSGRSRDTDDLKVRPLKVNDHLL
jgi:hypothetical protein